MCERLYMCIHYFFRNCSLHISGTYDEAKFLLHKVKKTPVNSILLVSSLTTWSWSHCNGHVFRLFRKHAMTFRPNNTSIILGLVKNVVISASSQAHSLHHVIILYMGLCSSWISNLQLMAAEDTFMHHACLIF